MATANHVLLQRTTLTATTASITLDNIPQTGYTDLKLVYSARYDVSDADLLIQFNGSTASFSGKRLYGTGSAVASDSSGRVAGVVDASNWTANTFSNGEIYIPNYTSSNYKSFGSDSVSENNATQAYAYIIAGLWSNTAAITSITLGTVGSQFVAGSSFSLYAIADANTTPKSSPKALGGDIVKSDGTYWYHAFLSSGTFTPQLNLTCDYLIVAGGGAGGSTPDGQHGGGGGGAGGFRGFSAQALTSSTNYPVVVGAGGSTNTSGSDSLFNGSTSTGGGYGGIGGSGSGASGGSGGGGSSSSSPGSGGAGNTPSTSPVQGYAGGNGQGTNNYACGGGGGATAVGYAGGIAPDSINGKGGAGSNAYSTWATATGTGASGYYAGGGGGGFGQFGNWSPGSGGGTGGVGGGGNGATANTNSVATSGTANTGGGGGGSAESGRFTNSAVGGNGGSGIIIIRYPV